VKHQVNIGTSVPRSDAYDKVTGKTKYAADYYGNDLLWAGAKRAGIPHAAIKGIDTTRAQKLPDVVAVLTHEDVLGSNRQGVVRKDQPVLADDKVRHCGDAVALVLAGNKEALKKALDLIRVDYGPLPGVFSVEEALKDGAPRVHEGHPEGNVLLKADLEEGKGLEAFGECDIVVSADFETPIQEHAYLETEVGWAQQEDDGRIVIIASTQTPFRDRTEVAEALGLSVDSIRIVAPYAGGAFGGKDGITVQSLLGLAALHAKGRPVKMWWEREESFVASTKRHATQMHYRLGAKSDGTLHALEANLFFDTGPYDHLGGVVLTLAMEHAGGPYRIPNSVLKGRCVYTNNPIGGAFRAFGVTQVTGAMEQMMDMVAAKLEMDPLEIRSKNAVTKGDRTCLGITLTGSTGLTDCLKVLARHPLWTRRKIWKSLALQYKHRGVGIAALMHAAGYGPVVPDYANAKVELTDKGTIRVYCGVVDMGQGNASTNMQIAGSILAQESDQMELVLPDTDRTLPSGSASASRCTYTFGNALIGASNALKKRILNRAADVLMAEGIDELALIPGKVRHLKTGRDFPLSRIAQLMNGDERIAVHHFRAPVARDNVGAAPELRLHGLGHAVVSYGAHLACVEVDETNGEVEVAEYLAISDCGKVINPQIYEQQIHGALAQGIGFALLEDFSVDQGLVITKDLSTYVIPTSMDVPEMNSIPVEIFEPTGPYGLKGVGEVSSNGPLPAIANAVADACGIRVFRSPITSERILDAFERAVPQRTRL
jgi:CO/xanthine dehydrogenase Mo-binding subunit